MTYSYAKKNTSSFSANVPSKVGTYKVKAAVAETENYYGGTATALFKIAKAENTINASNKYTSYSTKAQTVKLGATAASGKLTYKSSNSSVKVTESGVVKLPKNYSGTVKITITAKGDNYKTVKKVVKVVVPAAPKLSSAKNTAANKVTVKWKKRSGVSGYQIQYATNKNFKSAEMVTVKGASKVSKALTGLANYKTYYVRVRSYKTFNGKNYYSAWSQKKAVKVYIPKSTTFSSVKNSEAKKITVKWKTVKGVSGYQIQYATNRNFKSAKTVKVKGDAKQSRTITCKNNYKTYYVRIRTYKTVSGKTYYSSWSASNAVGVYLPTSTSLSSVKNAAEKKITVKWKKVSGVSGYQIQYAMNKNFKSAKSVTVKGAKNISKTITDLKKNQTYYVRVRTYKTVSGKTYYSAWSTKKSVKITK